MEKLRNLENEKTELIKEIFKRPIVIGVEGGPCAGKTTFVESLKTIESDRPIVVLPEVPTRIGQRYLESGVDILEEIRKENNIHGVLTRQFAMETLWQNIQQIEEARRKYYGTDAIIVADRVDCAECYMDCNDYQTICDRAGLTHSPSFELVDKILYFPTIAHKDQDAYSRLKDTNPVRRESAQEAIAACNSTLKAVADCPELHYIDYGDFSTSLKAATQYVLNPEKEFEYGGFLLSGMQGKWWSQLDTCRHLGTSYIRQSYHTLNNMNYRIREESSGADYSIRRTVSIKNPKDHTEQQRLISLQEADVLKQGPESSLSKTRERFLYTDPQTGITDVWCLDDIEVGKKYTVWAFEVERHSQEALKTVHPPFEHYLDKFCSNHGLARLALMFS